MSKHFRSEISHSVHYIVQEIKESGNEYAKDVHGIDINENGSVFDPIYRMEFASISDWAEFSISEDQKEYDEGMHHDESWS